MTISKELIIQNLLALIRATRDGELTIKRKPGTDHSASINHLVFEWNANFVGVRVWIQHVNSRNECLSAGHWASKLLLHRTSRKGSLETRLTYLLRHMTAKHLRGLEPLIANPFSDAYPVLAHTIPLVVP